MSQGVDLATSALLHSRASDTFLPAPFQDRGNRRLVRLRLRGLTSGDSSFLLNKGRVRRQTVVLEKALGEKPTLMTIIGLPVGLGAAGAVVVAASASAACLAELAEGWPAECHFIGAVSISPVACWQSPSAGCSLAPADSGRASWFGVVLTAWAA